MSHNKIQNDLSVSCIIPFHKADEILNKSIDSVLSILRENDELILVADGLQKNSVSINSEKNIKILSTDKLSGPAAARNLGSENAKGDILFFIDSDVTVKPGTINKLVKAFSSDENLSAVIGSYDDEPAHPSFISQYKNLFHHYVHQNANEDASTFWGACGAIRKNVFNKLNGFDENYEEPSIEDIEFGYRIINSGYKISLLKDLQIKHFKKWTFISLIKTDFFKRALPWTKLLLREKKLINDLNLKKINRLNVTLLFLFLILISAGFWYPLSFIPGIVSGIVIIILNIPLYRFFKRKRGFLFALKVVPIHWLYLFYSGIAFLSGAILYKLERLIFFPSKKYKSKGELVKKPV